MGAKFGNLAGTALARITGQGDYRIQSNSLLTQNSIPSFSADGDGIRIRHREFCTDVSSGATSTAFFISSTTINPVNSQLFPWLYKVALQFEEWEPQGIVFQYKPTSGTYNGTNQSLGAIMLATQYNMADAAFASKSEMDSYEYANSCVPFQGMLHPVECKSKMNPLGTYYCWPSTNGTPTGTGLATSAIYDLGRVAWASAGVAGTSTYLGEMWISYDIVFRKPRVNTTTTTSMYRFGEGAVNTAAAANPLGTGTPIVYEDSLRAQISTPTSSTILMSKPGYYSIFGLWNAAGSIAAVPTFTLGSNLAAVNLIYADAASTAASFTATKAHITYHLRVVTQGYGAANTITIGGLTGLAAGTCDIIVMPSGTAPTSGPI